MTARYLLCPSLVRSRTDGDWHHITARQLAHLYGVSMAECLVLPAVGRERFAGERLRLIKRCEVGGDLAMLGPRDNGDYTLPKPQRPANPYGCHNRAPTAASDCQYTLSALGQADPRCVGCRWRRAP